MPSKGLTVRYKPHAKQQEFHALVETNLVTAFSGGVGSGKTLAGCQEMIRQAFIAQPKSYGAVFAPTFPMLRDSTLKTCMEILPPEITAAYNRSENRIPFPNGSEVIFRSTEHPERNRGTNLDWIWFDEPSLMPKMAYDVALARLRGSDKRKAWLTMTPKGKLHWTYGEFHTAKADRAVVFASSHDNPYLPAGYVEQLRQSYSGRFFEQEVEGRFVAFEGLIYDMLQDELHQIDRPVQEMSGGFYGAIDWGFDNPCAIGVAGLDADDRWHVFEEIHQSHLTLEAIIDLCRDLMTRYPIKAFYCDPSGASSIESLNQAGIPAEGAVNDVVEGIMTMTALLTPRADARPGLTFAPNVVKTYAELKQYQWRQTAEGKPNREEPLKVNDHGPDMVRYLCHTYKMRGGQVPGVVSINWETE
jgi:PBSX family phage terminase large subunit